MDLLLRKSSHLIDIVADQNDLLLDEDLQSAIFLSLFTDQRADEGDLAESKGGGGYWGDLLGSEGAIGSKLWLLKRSKPTRETLLGAEQYCREAVAWLMSDAVVQNINVNASFYKNSSLCISIEIQQKNGALKQSFSYSWGVSDAI